MVRPTEEDLRTVKAAGYDDGQIVEIIEHVALSVFTNYIKEALKTEIDHPAVSFRKAS